MTPGATAETVDGMSMGKIGRIIDAMRHERYRFSPARRVYIVRREALCCIPNTVGRNLEDRFWA
jgi:retron-type reverse transcriptase